MKERLRVIVSLGAGAVLVLAAAALYRHSPRVRAAVSGVITLAATLNMNSHTITGLLSPINNNDATTKGWVSSQISASAPAGWSCTMATDNQSCGANCYVTAQALCSGSGKVVAGGCNVNQPYNQGGGAAQESHPYFNIATPSQQGWACGQTFGTLGGGITAYANCCQ